MYAVIQLGGPIFGTGETPDAALADASEWLDEPVDDMEQLPAYGEAADGDLVIAPVTDRLALAAANDGDIVYELTEDRQRFDIAESA